MDEITDAPAMSGTDRCSHEIPERDRRLVLDALEQARPGAPVPADAVDWRCAGPRHFWPDHGVVHPDHPAVVVVISSGRILRVLKTWTGHARTAVAS